MRNSPSIWSSGWNWVSLRLRWDNSANDSETFWVSTSIFIKVFRSGYDMFFTSRPLPYDNWSIKSDIFSDLSSILV